MAEITTEDITNGNKPGATPPGTGVFDQLMYSNQIRLELEYNKTRIRGADYGKVYLGTMEAIMQQSIVFLLGKQKADKEAELIEEQTNKTVAEIDLIIKQGGKIDAEVNLLIDQLLTEALKRDQLTAQINLLVDQLLTEEAKRDQLVAETALISQKTLTEVENTKLVIAKVTTEGKQQELIDKQILKMDSEIELITAQVEKAQHEIDLMEAQVWTERAKVSDDVSITNPPVILSGLMGGQIRKIDNEGLLLAEKVITEEAQTKNVAEAESVLGKQMALYQAQTDGFSRDAEQKLTKILVDTWNTRRVTDDGLNPCGTGLEDPSIEEIVQYAKEGIGMTDIYEADCTEV